VADVAAAEPLEIRYSVWVGYGPLFLAQERGYFDEEKVDVEQGRGPGRELPGVGRSPAGRVVSTIDTTVLHLRTGREFQYVLALDDSAGGDGIVARKEISRSPRGSRVDSPDEVP
jgi:NitT/TauT family transport system substrate-binding protein